MLTGQPFDDLQSVIDQLPDADGCGEKKIRTKLIERQCVSEDGVADMLAWLGRWQGSSSPTVKEAHICILVSSYKGLGDKRYSIDFLEKTSKGAAPVNVFCMNKGIGLRAIELAPQLPHDISAEWTQQDCMAAVAFGMEATASGGQILGLSDMAPGNQVPALAILDWCSGQKLEGLGEVIDFPSLEHARKLLREKSPESALEALRLLGGREIAAAVGAIVAARSRRLPVILDGWAGLAACAVLEACRPGATDHVLPASGSEMQSVIWTSLGKTCQIATPIDAGAGCGTAAMISLLDIFCSLLLLREA